MTIFSFLAIISTNYECMSWLISSCSFVIDVIFFDESIDAKMNRYTFKTRNIDTPFLSSGTHKYLKTYVAPSVNTSLIEYSILQMDPTIELKRKDNTTFIKYKRFPVLR